MRAQYVNQQAAELEEFVDFAQATARDGGRADTVLDSASISIAGEKLLTSEQLPSVVKKMFLVVKEEDHKRVLDAVNTGAEIFRREHGCLPTGDVVLAALQQGLSAMLELNADGNIRGRAMTLDNVGSTDHHDQLSYQPNRLVVAITSAIAEAIPFATYLPTDIGSNESRLGIVSHVAGKTFGEYTQNDLMDGVNIGKVFTSAARRVLVTQAGDRLSGTAKITGITGGSEDTQLLRGRTLVYVNGFVVGREIADLNTSVASSPLSGTIRISGVDYVVGGTVTVATGVVALTFAPALPAGTIVNVEGFIDYEKAPTLTPRIVTNVNTFTLYATPWRTIAQETIDTRGQSQNELGLDLQSENLMAIRNQFGMERHYMALKQLFALATANGRTYDFNWSAQLAQKTRAQVWQDAMAVIGVADQTMAEDTMDHGITHWYVGKNVAAQLQSLPSDLWVSSGITVRPGIFYLGRAFGRYEVYYCPTLLTDGPTAAQILCIGRSTQVARCPVVLGDAIAPTYLPLAMGTDMVTGNAFYARNFTSVNPHQPSARGAAIINITNLA